MTLSNLTSQKYRLFLLQSFVLESSQVAVVELCAANQWLVEGAAFNTVDQHCTTLDLVILDSQIDIARTQFKALAARLQIDLVLVDHGQLSIEKKLAVFDMDSTLIKVEVIDELAKKAGVGEQVIEITAKAMRGELDFSQSFKQRLGLLKGLSEDVLADIAQNLPMMESMETLIKGLQARGYKTAILSGGFSYFANFLQEKYGFDYAFSNQLDVVDAKVTGKVVGDIVNAEQKVVHLTHIAAREGIDLSQTIAVGDGANDLPMLATAGLGVAFHAKPLVVEKATHSISTLGLDALLYLLPPQD